MSTHCPPVAIFAFNRPECTCKVFNAVRHARPGRLFLCMDGARSGNQQDAVKREEIIRLFRTVDWDCEVHRNYSDVNLGCRERMGSGISWVFEHVDQAVLLEDDCLPHPDFFQFCGELLDTYKDDPRVGMIAGHIEHYDRIRCRSAYYFDKLNTIWGWATWKRAWELFDGEMVSWPSFRDGGKLVEIFPTPRQHISLTHMYEEVFQGNLESWAAAWSYSCVRHGKLCLHPSQNLIKNIGYGTDATHTLHKYSPWSQLPYGSMDFPLRHPQDVMVNVQEQNRTFDRLYAPTLRLRIKNRVKRLLNLGTHR